MRSFRLGYKAPFETPKFAAVRLKIDVRAENIETISGEISHV